MINLKVVTPQGVIHESIEVYSITLTCELGVITVMKDHIPLMSIVKPGEIQIKDQKGNIKALSVSKGIIEVRRNSVVNILADTAERAEEIDIERAESARIKALEFLQNNQGIEDHEVEFIRGQIDKELARINVGKKYKDVGRSQM